MKKQIANIITVFRMIGTIGLLLLPIRSVGFLILYLCCGISDALDGIIARKLHQESVLGARLDSISDTMFFLVVVWSCLSSFTYADWILICITGIVVVRVLSAAIGAARFHRPAFLHTYLNKAAGLVLFCYPVAAAFWEPIVPAMIVCLIAFLSGIEELILNAAAKELNLNQKGLFWYLRH